MTLLVLIPLCGWTALSVLRDTEPFGETPVWRFGCNEIPPILPQRHLDGSFSCRFVGAVHHHAIYTGATLLALHMVAGLRRRLVRRDGALLPMWPSTTGAEP